MPVWFVHRPGLGQLLQPSLVLRSFVISGQRLRRELQIFRRRARFLGTQKNGLRNGFTGVSEQSPSPQSEVVMQHFTFLRPIKNPADLDLRGFRMWRPRPESNRRGRICKPGLKSLITAVCRLFGVPLVANLLCLTGRILSRLGLRLWTQKSSI